jgi:hypothetical protein
VPSQHPALADLGSSGILRGNSRLPLRTWASCKLGFIRQENDKHFPAPINANEVSKRKCALRRWFRDCAALQTVDVSSSRGHEVDIALGETPRGVKRTRSTRVSNRSQASTSVTSQSTFWPPFPHRELLAPNTQQQDDPPLKGQATTFTTSRNFS